MPLFARSWLNRQGTVTTFNATSNTIVADFQASQPTFPLPDSQLHPGLFPTRGSTPVVVKVSWGILLAFGTMPE
jgi:hypothetical protein